MNVANNKPDSPDPGTTSPLPLDYAGPPRRDYAVPIQPLAVVTFIAGFGLAALATVALGVLIFLNEDGFNIDGPSLPHPLSAACWFVAATAAVANFVRLVRVSKRRSFVLGLLIGCALAALIEGMCFVHPN